jgi:hypothetical protein
VGQNKSTPGQPQPFVLKLLVTGTGSPWRGDRHNPSACKDVMLVPAKDFPQATPRPITPYRRPKAL